jgi:hypothetical protein
MQDVLGQTTESSCDPMRSSESFSTALQVGGFRGTEESARRSMDVYIPDDPKRAGRTIGEMDREMPAKRVRVKGGTGHIECHANFTMQPPIDEGNCLFISGGDQLWAGRALIAGDNVRHKPLLSW